MSERLNRIRTAMQERGLEGLVVSRPENRLYLTGFTGSAGWGLITADSAWLVTDFRYVEQAQSQAPDFTPVKASAAHYATLAGLLGQAGVRNLGFEGDFLTFDEYGLYDKHMDGVELRSATGLVEELRVIKDLREQEAMQQAAAIADQAWSQIQPLIKPGVTERQLALELEITMKRLGARDLAFDIIVASGVRSSLPHGVASEKVIERGDLVTFDFGAKFQAYCSDMTRTVAVGEISPKQQEIYEIVLEAQRRGVSACRPGMTGQELDEVCRSYITQHGYGDAFGHGTGHGVGLQIHEGPRVNMRAEREILKPGMVVTIEPGIYLPGWGGVRIEDMVLVTEGGCRSFSQSSKELTVL